MTITYKVVFEVFDVHDKNNGDMIKLSLVFFMIEYSYCFEPSIFVTKSP